MQNGIVRCITKLLAMQNKIARNAKQNCWQCKTILLAMQNKIVANAKQNCWQCKTKLVPMQNGINRRPINIVNELNADSTKHDHRNYKKHIST